MKVLIKITKEVLESSKMCGFTKDFASRSCMIAVAVRDLFPDASIGNPNYQLIFDDPNDNILPDFVCKKIIEFDRLNPSDRLDMQPFSFEIEVPEYVIEKIGIGEIYRVLSESKTLELVMEDFGQTGQS